MQILKGPGSGRQGLWTAGSSDDQPAADVELGLVAKKVVREFDGCMGTGLHPTTR
jgi:hypothetical protein